jgi:hypothetical protein
VVIKAAIDGARPGGASRHSVASRLLHGLDGRRELLAVAASAGTTCGLDWRHADAAGRIVAENNAALVAAAVRIVEPARLG